MAGRKRRLDGTVIRKSDGGWEARMWVHPADGGKPTRRSRRARTRVEAQEKLRELNDEALALASERKARRDGVSTWQDWMERYPAVLEAQQSGLKPIRERTVTDNLAVLRRYVTPHWTNYKLADIRPSDVDTVLGKMVHKTTGKKLSANTRRHAVLAIRKALTAAARDGLVSPEVIAEIGVPDQVFDGVRPTPDMSDVEAVWGDLIAMVPQHPSALLVLVGTVTGARRGELCSMRFADVVGGVWTVSLSATVAQRTLVENKPKTGIRRVTLPTWLVGIIDAERRREPIGRIYLGETPGRPGQPCHPDALGAWFRTFAKRHGLVSGGMHSLRRAVSTYLVNYTGGDLDLVSRAVGNSPHILRTAYVPDRDERIAKVMKAAFAEPTASAG